MDPSASSMILGKARAVVDLPDPVLPTTPTFEPPLTMKDRFFKVNFESG